MESFKFGNGIWATKEGSSIAYNDENGNYKPLPFSVTRGSSATRVNRQGLIESVSNDKLRIDFKDSSKGVALLEPSRTNKLPYSEDFSEWSTSSGGSVSESQEGVGGSTDAFEFTSDGSANSRIFYAISATGTHSFSVFAKKNTLDYISLYANDDNNSRVWYNLDNGTLGNQEGGGTGTIEDYGGGWYRCTLKWNSSNLVNVRIYNSNANDVFGGTLGSVYIQYAQLEAGSYPTSYIPTSGSSATRSADVANGAGNSNVFNDSQGVLFANIAALEDGGSSRYIMISDGTTSNRIQIFYSSTSNRIYFEVIDGGVSQVSEYITISQTEFNKILIKYKQNDISIYSNGFEVGTDTSATMPSGLNELSFDRVGASNFYGKTKRIGYFDEVLTDAELETLTSYTSFTEMANELNLTIK